MLYIRIRGTQFASHLRIAIKFWRFCPIADGRATWDRSWVIDGTDITASHFGDSVEAAIVVITARDLGIKSADDIADAVCLSLSACGLIDQVERI